MNYGKLVAALVVSFFASVIFLLFLIPYLKRKKAGQQILCYVGEHSKKSGTPTMGGIAFVTVSIIVALFCCEGDKTLAQLTLATYFAYGVAGFMDDYLKIANKRNLGLKAYQKIVLQTGIAVILAVFCYKNMLIDGYIILPFTNKETNIGIWIIPLVVFAFLAMSNGVNLTDGLDGLAGSTSLVYLCGAAAFLIYAATEAFSAGRTVIGAEYFNLVIVCASVIGALCAFLIFNAFPAKIFMGDTGSLALGAVCACVLLLSKFTLLIPFLGVMFAVSCVSVIVQVVYFKLTKKRVFLKAPFHHHLQLKGLGESNICAIYSTITGIVSFVCFVFSI